MRRHLYGLAAVVLLFTLAPAEPAKAVPPIPSSWDYFHPNTSGQAVIASVSYANGFNW